ncbi:MULTISPECIES: CDGSH iron-sulfur domain-containing protein [Streptomyces]|uniref:CDGSH iron-sulfur domain-containing protein n=1 Tax=Streptomyces mutomycini TaxID=284036 RepID=A0ABW0B1U4_9ACTN|nr:MULTISPECIES: CDGSH iron-sulfur domain-containing protein [Streptomyces]KPC83998.1 iron-binding protein [Streptomyces sp. NRRL S-4]
MPNKPERPCRITLGDDGPLLVEGPVEITGPDGSVAVSDRFVVAVCMCRRSRMYPWCDTSHRRRARPGERHDTAD